MEVEGVGEGGGRQREEVRLIGDGVQTNGLTLTLSQV